MEGVGLEGVQMFMYNDLEMHGQMRKAAQIQFFRYQVGRGRLGIIIFLISTSSPCDFWEAHVSSLQEPCPASLSFAGGPHSSLSYPPHPYPYPR